VSYVRDTTLVTTRTLATRPSIQIKIGTYAGDATDNRVISGIGFRPDFVLIKGGANTARWRSSTMSGDSSAGFATTGSNTADMIQNFYSDGFAVGTNASVNAAATTYYYVAIRARTSQSMTFGAYRGTGVDDRSITGLLFQPDFVFIKGDNSSANAAYRTSLMSGDVSGFYSATASSNDVIQSLLPTGFQVGASVHVNTSGSQYNYWALKNVPGVMKVGQYTGDGTDDRNITGLGFQPDIVIVKSTATTGSGRMRLSNEVGDDTLRLPAFASSANEVQSLISDGFQVGTAMNASATVYDYVALKAGDFMLPFTRTAV
jgi:hypothetical protein